MKKLHFMIAASGMAAILCVYLILNFGRHARAYFSPHDGIMDDSTFIVSSIYHYRVLGLSYEGFNVTCMYGELCIPNYIINGVTDTLNIQWAENFPLPGIDTTASYINARTRSLVFELHENTTLSMFRMIGLGFLDTSSSISIPDTTAWILQLWNVRNNTLIATIDSVGICKTIDLPPGKFPETFGGWSENAYELASIELGSYFQAGEVDSVFITLRIINWDPQTQDADCGIYDDKNINTKFSEVSGLSSAKPSLGTRPDHSTSQLTLSLFPNPTYNGRTSIRLFNEQEQYLKILLFDNTGREIDLIKADILASGTHIIPYYSNMKAGGVYHITVRNATGNTLLSEKITYIK